jgi:two-component SAPR family response regulator
MSNQTSRKSKKENRVYKSLYEVKDKYLPNAELEFLESKDDDLSREAFMKMFNKVTRPVQAQPAREK